MAMTESLQIGIIRVGQFWCVVSAAGRQAEFATRELAVAEADAIASGYREKGVADCAILVQDEAGQLRPLAAAHDRQGAGHLA